MVMVAVLLLSGCNLNTGSVGDSASETVTPVAKTVTSPVEEVTSNGSYKVGAMEKYDRAKFEAALIAGETIFLDFYASWCPTCRANEPIVDAVFDGNIDAVGFRVDYDNETELKKKYSVVSQSTYLILRNGEELDRYLGALTADKVSELLN